MAIPMILVGDGDVGGLVGIHLREEMRLQYPVVSIDGLELKEFDYIDIGALLDTSGAVPVVIKSLIFPTTAALGKAAPILPSRHPEARLSRLSGTPNSVGSVTALPRACRDGGANDFSLGLGTGRRRRRSGSWTIENVPPPGISCDIDNDFAAQRTGFCGRGAQRH